MKIVVLDTYPVSAGGVSFSAIKELGECRMYESVKGLSEEDVIKRIGDAEIVVSNYAYITKNVIDSCPGMKFVADLGTGYNCIDVEYAAEKGIPVANVPDYGVYSVSQFAIALLLELCHHIGEHSKPVKQGIWEGSDWYRWDDPLVCLEGMTMGLYGLGNIGRQTAVLAKALGMKTIYFTNHPKAENEELAHYVSLDELWAQSDVISLHMPLLPFNEKLINAESIGKMKNGAIIINTARGKMIDEQALADALNGGKLAGAGLDVLANEPPEKDCPLLNAKNCIITPHIAWGAKEGRQRMVDCAAENIKAFMRGEFRNVVNMKLDQE